MKKLFEEAQILEAWQDGPWLDDVVKLTFIKIDENQWRKIRAYYASKGREWRIIKKHNDGSTKTEYYGFENKIIISKMIDVKYPKDITFQTTIEAAQEVGIT